MIRHDTGGLARGIRVDVAHFGIWEKRKRTKIVHIKRSVFWLLNWEEFCLCWHASFFLFFSSFFLKKLHNPWCKMSGCSSKQLLHVIIVKYLPSFPQLWSPSPYPCLSSGGVGTWFIVALQRHANYTVHKALHQKSEDRHSGDSKLHL